MVAINSDATDIRGTGQMDFPGNFSDKKLTIINGVGYNSRDAGNYAWGYTMGKMGFMSITARLAAHVNDWKSGKQQNRIYSSNPNPVLRWIENRSWTGDSAADQRAIQNGLNDSGSYWKSKLNGFKRP